MTKKELIDSFQPTQTYLGSFIRSQVNQISNETRNVNCPASFKKGDVYLSYCGVKSRPCVVVKVFKDFVVGIPLTSGENIHSSVSYKCRFLGEGFLGKTIDIASKEYVKTYFAGVFEDKRAIKEALENIKEFINKL